MADYTDVFLQRGTPGYEITKNSPNGSEPNGLLKGSFIEELESLLSVVFLESELPSEGLKGSELKKLSVGL